jgi:hypothetical protein
MGEEHILRCTTSHVTKPALAQISALTAIVHGTSDCVPQSYCHWASLSRHRLPRASMRALLVL